MGRKKYSGKLKAQVALEALKEEKTIGEIAGIYGVHPNQIRCQKQKNPEKQTM